MTRPDDPLGRLGRRLAQAQDEVLGGMGGLEMDRVRDRLLAHRRTGRGGLMRWGGAVAVAAAAAVVVLVLREPRALSFRVGAARSDGAVGAFVAMPAGRSTPVRFSDGTVLTVAAESAARVVQVGPSGARVVVERGRVHAAVRHRADARWEIGVGPFDVRVTGTRFDVSWDPAAEEFSLSLERGSLRVSGPLVGEGRRIAAGERVRVAVREARLEITSGEETVATARTPARAVPQANVIPEASPAPTTSAPHAPSWRDLARAGRWADALAAAEAIGFDPLCAQSGPADLALLGDAARLARRPDRAVQAFQTLRRRFPGDRRSAEAAFQLGRLSSGGDAARWFQTSVSEGPNGTFAREAAGRLLEALPPQSEAARDAARAYLARYPTGPHAARARSIVGE